MLKKVLCLQAQVMIRVTPEVRKILALGWEMEGETEADEGVPVISSVNGMKEIVSTSNSDVMQEMLKGIIFGCDRQWHLVTNCA
ncbi:hypothetical protein PIB30_056281 [Stylosanthes scabra]|uniref:Uncharacterized protein n=1 Tax=Stylosanthes scabra TaxID=79078 RepID=A0ABU6VKD4_9FABA|nr:hypothetical protein [Stylosanthes scabra]